MEEHAPAGSKREIPIGTLKLWSVHLREALIHIRTGIEHRFSNRLESATNLNWASADLDFLRDDIEHYMDEEMSSTRLVEELQLLKEEQEAMNKRRDERFRRHEYDPERLKKEKP